MPKAGEAGLRSSHDVDEQTRPFTNTRQAVQMRDEFICSAVIAIVAIDSSAVPGTAQARQGKRRSMLPASCTKDRRSGFASTLAVEMVHDRAFDSAMAERG